VTSPFLTPEEAAAFLLLSPSTLEKLRVSGKGPAYRAHGDRKIAYAPADLLEWSESRKRHSTSDLKTEDVAAAGPPSS